jgi:hypothetical protein
VAGQGKTDPATTPATKPSRGWFIVAAVLLAGWIVLLVALAWSTDFSR